jgi:hypothetical protein
MPTARRLAWFLSSLLLLLVSPVSSCTTSPGQIEIVHVPAPGAAASAGRLGDYESALTAIVNAFEGAVGLPRPDAALVVFPSRRSFEQGLLELGYTPSLARSASTFNAIGGAKAVLVNGAVVGRFDRARRVRLLAHELVHTIQYQFGGGTRGASEQWLREGFAEWVACRITAHLGLGSFERLREEVLGALVGVDVGLPPAPFDQLATFAQWVEAQGRYETPLYAQAFIAAELLIEMRDVPTLVRYFERFRSTTEYQRVFTETFGLDRTAFEHLFLRRWRDTVSQYSVRRE